MNEKQSVQRYEPQIIYPRDGSGPSISFPEKWDGDWVRFEDYERLGKERDDACGKRSNALNDLDDIKRRLVYSQLETDQARDERNKAREHVGCNEQIYVRQQAELRSERDQALSEAARAKVLLRRLWEVAPEALTECRGDKCRLPHCISCNGEQFALSNEPLMKEVRDFLSSVRT